MLVHRVDSGDRDDDGLCGRRVPLQHHVGSGEVERLADGDYTVLRAVCVLDTTREGN